MAREEADREDLLAEATALVERAELAIDGAPHLIVIGFRTEGAVSIYDGDSAYHFNSDGELRRMYLEGRLYKAERRRLVALRRHRTDKAVELLREELDHRQTYSLLCDVYCLIMLLEVHLKMGGLKIVRQVPADDRKLYHRIWDWVMWMYRFGDVRIAASPHAC